MFNSVQISSSSVLKYPIQKRANNCFDSFGNTIDNRHRIVTRMLPYASNRPSEAQSDADVLDAVTGTDRPKLSLWQRVGQSFNSAGVVYFSKIAFSDRSMAVPHLSVPNLLCVDWYALKSAGFEGCIFDKDNTLTEPYQLTLHPTAVDALEECRTAFEGRIALYSNSAGLDQFDPEGREAEKLEHALGIPVMRHKDKKPAGGPEDLEAHFGCSVDKLIMIGDRYLTDIAFGNRLGMLTVRPEPFTSVGETTAVRAARAIEGAFVGQCQKAGVLPPTHHLVRQPAAQTLASFVKDL